MTHDEHNACVERARKAGEDFIKKYPHGRTGNEIREMFALALFIFKTEAEARAQEQDA